MFSPLVGVFGPVWIGCSWTRISGLLSDCEIECPLLDTYPGDHSERGSGSCLRANTGPGLSRWRGGRYRVVNPDISGTLT